METKIKTKTYGHLFSEKINDLPKSFLREILKLTSESEIISFAGGLPNPESFPIENLKEATSKVLEKDLEETFQYTTTEGYYPLREWIAENYRKKYCWDTQPEEIIITNGSQQGLDLLGKVFLNRNDQVLIERPSYLGAIQALSYYKPQFISCPLNNDGLDLKELQIKSELNSIKLAYLIPDYQNPTGISYTKSNRQFVAEIMRDKETILIEDNPYGEINFSGEVKFPIREFRKESSILLGTFSKVIAPGLRTGWIYAPKEIIGKLTLAKQASDLHTNLFAQKVIFEYLRNNNTNDHLNKIIGIYEKNCREMYEAIQEYFPSEIKVFKPEGGMFIWAKLPEKINAWDLLTKCIERGVVFAPGSNFFLRGEEENNTIRLSYSGTSLDNIKKGIKILGQTIKEFIY